MPVFEYKGVNAQGKVKKGLVDAENVRNAKERLKREGVFIQDIRQTNKEAAAGSEGGNKLLSKEIDIFSFLRTVSQQEVTIMTRLFANLVGAHIPVVDALTAIIDQVENPQFKKVLSQVREDVNEGSSLSEAMSKFPKIFTPLYSNMIRAGESSGSLNIVMNRLADFTEHQFALGSKVRGAMTYPVIMLIFAFLVIGVLFVVVIPKITTIFEDAKIALPIQTRLLIGISEFVAGYWFLILPMIGFIIYGFKRWKNTKTGRMRWDRFKLHVPLFGELNIMIAVSRFSRTLGTMLSSGVPLLTAMDIVKNILGNVILVDIIEKAREEVREGESIAVPLRNSKEFPPIVTHMIAIGEKSGELEEMLEHISRTYDVQVESKLNTLTALLEPAMIIFMGIVVVFIVMSVLMPIMQINQSVG